MNNEKIVKVPFNGKGRKLAYTVEIIELPMTAIGYLNVYTVFVDDPELIPHTGSSFTLLHHPTATVMPAYAIRVPGNVEEINLKKAIAQQVMNDPG